MQVISIIPNRVIFSGGLFDSEKSYIHQVGTGGDFAFPAGRTMYMRFSTGFNPVAYEFNGFFKGSWNKADYSPYPSTNIIKLSGSK